MDLSPEYTRTVRLATDLAEHVASNVVDADEDDVCVQDLAHSLVTFIESDQWREDQAA